MTDSEVYSTLQDVLNDDLFPQLDCDLRQGKHIGQEDLTAYSFLEEAFPYLYKFYRKFSCELVHDTSEESGFFFLSSYGDMFGKRQLSAAEMIVGMGLAYMLMDPEYISKRIPFERLVFTLKTLLGEEPYFSRMAPRIRGKNTEGDEQKAEEEVAKAVRRLGVLGFLTWSRTAEFIIPKSPIFRFISPVRGAGNLESNIKLLMDKGLLETSELGIEDEGDDNV
jgi:chromosome partition protein MukE